jgi:hypothetical protein
LRTKKAKLKKRTTNMSLGYWVKENEAYELGALTHEQYAVQFGLVSGFTGFRAELATDETIRLACLQAEFVRVRQYRQHWSVQLREDTQLPAETLGKLISQLDKHAELRITWLTSQGSEVDKLVTTVSKL